ncbi:MAG: hypothetical protein RQM92_06810 [Candidatus Syntrophopropionicum ammoniitolerans]
MPAGLAVLDVGTREKAVSLLKHFGSARVACGAGVKELARASGLRPKDPEKIVHNRAKLDPAKEAAKLRHAGIDFICYDQPGYPENLLQIFDPPPVIFIKGFPKTCG